MRYIVCRDIVEEIMADLAWFSALLILFCSSPGILRQPQHLARERETFGYLFCPCTPYGSRVSLIGEEERKKENDVFLASIKLSGNERTYLYSGGSGLSIDIHFVDIELSYDVLSPLPIVLSKYFNHPHPYIEIATAISDIVCNECVLQFALYNHVVFCVWSFFLRQRLGNWYKNKATLNGLTEKECGKQCPI